MSRRDVLHTALAHPLSLQDGILAEGRQVGAPNPHAKWGHTGFHADVSRAYMPVLLGLDVMQRYVLVLYFDKDEVSSVLPNWKMEIVDQLEQCFTTTPVTGLQARRKQNVVPDGTNFAT